MCFFDQTRWSCGYWRWGHFRGQCNKEWRTGETCGLKFVQDTTYEPDVCKLCKDIEKKNRRRQKLESDIARWSVDRSTRSASIDKARNDLAEVRMALDTMLQRHNIQAYFTV